MAANIELELKQKDKRIIELEQQLTELLQKYNYIERRKDDVLGVLVPPTEEAKLVFKISKENHPDLDMKAVPNQWLLNERARRESVECELAQKLVDEREKYENEITNLKVSLDKKLSIIDGLMNGIRDYIQKRDHFG